MVNQKQIILGLHNKNYFKTWNKIEKDRINFYISPHTVISNNWLKAREKIYKENSKKLNINRPIAEFYIFPSKESGEDIGITLGLNLPSRKEVYSHPNQSPGHELTHILLSELNSWKHLPSNGIWSEGLCVYLDGTKTNRKKQAITSGYSKEELSTNWSQWRENLQSKFYPLAGSIIQFLSVTYGWLQILKFIKSLRNRSNNDYKSCESIFGKKLKKIHLEWLNWLEN